jgi:two-component system sensor histidine kinase DesK
MKWLVLPTGDEKPSWAGLWGTVSMAYLFVDLYHRGGTWIEWLWTTLAFVVFLFLCVICAIYWSRPRIMRAVCGLITLLGIAFTLYRPVGVFFFIFVAAFGPLAVSGNLMGSAVITAGSILLIIGGWNLLWPPGLMPYIAAVEAFLIGGAITFVVRQQIAVRRIVKSSERERIAQDLHDILGHTLSVIIMKAELASRLFERDPQKAKTEIEAVERISRSALQEVRQAIHGYHDGDLQREFEGMKATLETAGIKVEQRCDTTDMTLSQERVLALVLREAATNIVRHANASRCEITLQKSDAAHQLIIHDNGRGGVGEEGMGMRGIRERVAAIGGTVSWKSESGTELTITVPMTTEQKVKQR